MKLLVIGHSVVDIFIENDEEVLKPGGIYYSTLGFNLMKRKMDEIFLVSSLDEKYKNLFSNLYSHINQRYVERTDEIPRVNLTLCKNQERGEKYFNLTEKLNITKLSELNKFDGIMINMITGFDLDLSSLQQIRQTYNGEIYIDIHTLSRGLDEQNKRYFRQVPGYKQWLNCVDIVQVNENELKTICSPADETAQVEEVLNYRPKILIVTRGETGATLFYKDVTGLHSLHEAALDVKAINQVGCGDVFGAAFFYSYILCHDLHESLKKANIAAGTITEHIEFNNIEVLRNDIFKRFG